jgi:putative pyruvate formate lyase activating enzyme
MASVVAVSVTLSSWFSGASAARPQSDNKAAPRQGRRPDTQAVGGGELAMTTVATDELETLAIWQEPDLRDALPWYRAVAANRMPAKFRIARHVPATLPPADAPEEAWWVELDARTAEFLDRWRRIRAGEGTLPGGPPPRPNLLDLCRVLTQRMLRRCTFCRWLCRVDRSRGDKLGACRLAGESRVSSYFHHPGEELIYRGRRGSGTIFFTSCNMRCAFCQNGDISTDKDNGEPVTARTLATMAWLLRREGCHNINWVGGEVTVHLHTIVEAIALLAELEPDDVDLRRALAVKADALPLWPQRPEGACYAGAFNAPMLWNSNFFMSEPALRILRVLMDVWLPDLKFGPGPCAVALARTPWYWETVTGNLKAVRDWGEDLTIRHLVMPGHVECCTRPVLEWIAATMPEVPVNVMDQYHPDNFCDPCSPKFDPKYRALARRPMREEVLQAFRYARGLGLRFQALSYEKNTTGLRV